MVSLTTGLHLAPPIRTRRFPTRPFNRISARSLPPACRVFPLSVQDAYNRNYRSASLGSASGHFASSLLLLGSGGSGVVGKCLLCLRSYRQGFNGVHCVYRCSRGSGRTAENLAVTLHRTLPVLIKLLGSNAAMVGGAVQKEMGEGADGESVV